MLAESNVTGLECNTSFTLKEADGGKVRVRVGV
jgi:hypothetical protein